MPRLSGDYSNSVVGASLSGLTELSVCLRHYRGALVLVGGWVPYFLLKEHQKRESADMSAR
jgi:hypothetical protein